MNEPFEKGNFYHIFNRGVNGMAIFYTPENYLYLLKKIKSSISQYGVDMIAYCLMPNHYHFLVRQLEDIPISRWIQSLFNGYTQAINKQLGRRGTLFQGRAKHILVHRDQYFIHLVRYIHCNPVQANLVKLPEEWPYSNYLEWIGSRKGTLVNRQIIHELFYSSVEYEKFITNYRIEKKLEKQLEKYFLEN